MAKKRTYTSEELQKIGNRVMKIRTDFCNDNNILFAEKVGIIPQTTAGICNGTKSVGRKTIDRILEAFPQVSRSWLILGEGPMLTGDIVTGDNSQQRTINGNNNLNSGSITNVDERLLKMLEDGQQERLKLLTIIENLTSK